MAKRHLHTPAPLLVGLLALSCAGQEPPPAEAPVTPSAPAQAAPAATDEAEAATAPTAPAEAETPAEAEPAKPEVYKPERPPRDILSTEDTAFEFNFSASQVGEETEAKCEGEADGDMKVYNECKRAAQQKVGITVQRFLEKNGTWWWLTYERRGNQMVMLHKIPFQWGEQTDNTIELKPSGKDEGMARMSPVPRTVVVTIPNSYAIELTDKVLGRMQYSTKIGMFPK